MKKISILLVAFAIATGLKAQNNNYHFISQLHQSVKYDSANKAYFVDKEINKVATINVSENAVSFITTEGNTSYITTIKIDAAQLDSLDKKMSFSINGIETKTGKHVKLGFWFIGEDLDEVNYIDVASQEVVGFKDLTYANGSEVNTSAKAVVSAKIK
ncbi:MAG: hypothetical protein QM802_12940 [Agriterribacter sp.]